MGAAFDASTEKRIRAWHARGWTQRRISEHLGMNRNTFNDRVKPLGLFWGGTRRMTEFCRRGHELAVVGVYDRSDGRRQCKRCHHQAAEASKKAHRAAQETQMPNLKLDLYFDAMERAETAPHWERAELHERARQLLGTEVSHA
jgi:hypothetical protein